MNTNENQLLNSLLVLAALANVSPEKLKEYANALSLKNMSTNVRSDDRFSDADIIRSALGLLRVYRDETIAHMAVFEKQPFLRKVTPAIGVLEDCLEYYSNKE
nr:MAG TPA: hypothetical protein [Caudoviricetes sp.]